ncbi:hypothetical protein BU14_0361s0009 [Porphyra umbilicalis]|uniref:Uncharacterized protein n=1 Tax=Porphyra umbilicalis TaxID=2786 RepID=A0A1X6NXH7_PORUM|nr:hypothetical protein BU14_0361s0009 [Porphyra umbilicalis]|eukprot:OSX73282.1 hypothetical protein BU14_0361s0009 [Porphyra umbilicalis]
MHLDACSCATIPPADVDVLCAAAFSPSHAECLCLSVVQLEGGEGELADVAPYHAFAFILPAWWHSIALHVAIINRMNKRDYGKEAVSVYIMEHDRPIVTGLTVT